MSLMVMASARVLLLDYFIFKDLPYTQEASYTVYNQHVIHDLILKIVHYFIIARFTIF